MFMFITSDLPKVQHIFKYTQIQILPSHCHQQIKGCLRLILINLPQQKRILRENVT